jgi:DNA helicase IV
MTKMRILDKQLNCAFQESITLYFGKLSFGFRAAAESITLYFGKLSLGFRAAAEKEVNSNTIKKSFSKPNGGRS